MDLIKKIKLQVDKRREARGEQSPKYIEELRATEEMLFELEKEVKEAEKEIKTIEHKLNLNIAGKLAQMFLKNPVTPVIALALMLLGFMAVILTPREENPQIDVPAANVIVVYPGASAKEVQNIVVEPLERKLKAIKGVKHIYGTSMNSVGVVTVRFKIGEDKVKSFSKVYDRVMHNIDELPKGVRRPLIKPIDIDEVPIVTFALASSKYSDSELYRMAQRLLTPFSKVHNVSIVGIKGGHKRQFNIILDPQKLAAYHLSVGQVAMALQGGNVNYPLGGIEKGKYAIPVEFNGFINTIDDVKSLMVANYMGRPIYVRDVAKVVDGVNFQDKQKTFFEAGESFEENKELIGKKLNQVTIFIGKKRGTNAVFVAEDLIKEAKKLQKELPEGVELIITRNAGEEANNAVNELIFHLVISIAIIVVLLIVMLGWRESLIVSFTVPLILAVTLFIGMLAGQTINRITLFALILALGLLVDSAIIVIENIHRHFELADKPRDFAVVYATNEIGNPTNIATLAIILAFVPMFFVTGMMGPYMRPIPFNVPIALISSLVIAYIFTPWAALKFLPEHHHEEGEEEHKKDFKDTKTYKAFEKILMPILSNVKIRTLFFVGLIGLLVVSISLPAFKIVLFKMLPGSNKNTFNITIDLPKGASLQSTQEVANCVSSVLKKEPEIKDFEQFIGIGGVIDFNGLLRGSSMKKGENVAEIRVNLKPKEEGRKESSIDMVSRLRPIIQGKCSFHEANIRLVEDPPGPPVLATLLMQVYGKNREKAMEIAEYIKGLYDHTKGVVDTDIMRDRSIIKYQIIPDKEKAAMLGITTDQIAKVLGLGIRGAVVSIAHVPNEKEQVGIYMRYDKKYRDTLSQLDNIKIMSMSTHRMVPLKEVVKVVLAPFDGKMTRKDLRDVVLVTGEMDKRGSLYALLDVFFELKDKGIPGYKVIYDGNPRLNLVAIDERTGEKFNLVWGGEWETTFNVFRDLGIAFGAAVTLIYLLMVVYYKNFRIPRIVLAAVPLTFIGVLPGHAFMNLLTIIFTGHKTYFTATSMIGFIALSGIVVRNSLLLIDFTNDLVKQGRTIEEATVEAAATRFRPIILTALAIILASFIIVLDPVWQGLAVSLIFGVLVSTILSVIVVPVLYWRYLSDQQKKEESSELLE